MELVFLGTGSAYPSPNRGASSVVLKTGSEGVWMFDCGEGTQTQLMKSSVRAGKITRIFITHLHGDHLFGLPGLLCTISQNSTEERDPVQIYGPEGLRLYLRTSLSLSRSLLGFKYCVNELVTAKQPHEFTTDGLNHWQPEHRADDNLHPNECPGVSIRTNENGVWEVCESQFFSVKAGLLKHRVVCFGYSLQETDLPGKLCVDKLKELGVPPGPLYGKLKKGEDIVTASGLTVKHEDVVGPKRQGRRIVVLGDTCDSSGMAGICEGADVLVHEATNENSHWEKCVENGHSTPNMAGEFASTMNCKTLILTHFSQRYKTAGAELKNEEESVDKLVREAAEVFTSGQVYTAEDLWVYSIPLPT